jgi:hypothetical protein
MPKMDERKLRAVLRAEKAAAMGEATGSASSDLAKQRTSAMDYYQGDMVSDMPSLEGRSSAVSTDVADTVDGIMPSLMDIFMSSDEVAKFEAVGPEDEDAAQQETDYVNHVFYNDNPGFITLHAMVKDALIQKNGIAKFWWEEGEDEERESYRSLTEDAFSLLAADESIEIIEHTPNKEMYGDGEVTLHDVTVIKRKPYGCVKVMAVPPEEFLIAKDARLIQDSRYCAHRVKRTRSQLIEQGYSKEKINSLPTGGESPSQEQEARATVNDNDEQAADVNEAMQLIEVTEHYLRVDYDGDGVAELRKVTTAGSGEEILDNEPYDRMPFASITPQLMSHRFWGRSVADIVMDIQKIKTALIRAVLDNAYFANNQRIEIAETHTTDNTLDDLLTNRPGGIVRTKAPGGLVPIPTNPIGHHLFPVLEYFDTVREVRTGVNRNAVGPDANSLNPYSNTATGANILATAAQQRIRLIARTFAETGIKDLFMGIHELILKHGAEARTVKLRDKWAQVDPRNWKTRKDMTILVGLGTGTRDQIQAYLMQVLGLQVQAIQMQQGPAGPQNPGLVTLQNVYNSMKKLIENAGFRSADPFVTPPDPSAVKPPPPEDPKVTAMKLKAQADQEKAQVDMAAKQQDMQLDRERAQMDIQKSILEMRLEMQKFMMEMGMRRQEFALDQQQDSARFGQEMRQTEMAGQINLRQAQESGEQKLELAEQAARQKVQQATNNPRSEG